MPVKLNNITVDIDSKIIEVDIDIAGTYITEVLNNSEKIINEIYNKALVQQEEYLKNQLEDLTIVN